MTLRSLAAVPLVTGMVLGCLSPTHCTIDGASYPEGALNPSANCQSCQLARSDSTWTDCPYGDTCPDGGGCVAGRCYYTLLPDAG